MGTFHGRRKPSAKKAAKPKGDTAEDVAARQARDQFIKDMAAKAASLLPAEAEDNGGIHPSRLARAAPVSGTRTNSNFAQYSQSDRPSRGQRAPDLRKPNKRTFDDAAVDGSVDHAQHPTKKQRTLEEIRKLKGPAAMKKEEEKRRRQAESEKAVQAAPATGVELKKEVAQVDSEDDETPIPSKNGKKQITNSGKHEKTPEEKLQRKLEKAARKKAKSAAQMPEVVDEAAEQGSALVPEQASEGESKEARKERKRAEKAAKKAASTEEQSAPVVTEHQETKEQKKERKRLAKIATKDLEVSTDEATQADEKKTRKASKKEKRAPKPAAEEVK